MRVIAQKQAEMCLQALLALIQKHQCQNRHHEAVQTLCTQDSLVVLWQRLEL